MIENLSWYQLNPRKSNPITGSWLLSRNYWICCPYTLKVGDEKIEGEKILLCIGSKPTIQTIKGLDQTVYHTIDSIK